MQTISIDGSEIPEAAIASEMQHHPAASLEASREEAARALVVRTLLINRAHALAIEAAPEQDENGKRETDEDALIRQLLEREVKTPEADEANCARYYENNTHRFTSPDLFEASHILFSADSNDEAAYKRAAEEAEAVLDILRQSPSSFEDLAQKYSACSSAALGGNLGQITRGQTTPEFETFLYSLEEGQLSPVPVKTRYGVHILKLHRRIDGKVLPFETVKDRIAAFLKESVYRRAISQYISLLAAEADIRGLNIGAATSPLVQ